ncbi:PDR/VanB family oxidoreductase [Pseudonocardia xishanensis]|uniref:PDR/VanB family oxidoreductase n=1 Tax=Pseudonocardia xishanensis TaxID=630995 RepID=A0ABP8RYB2_9PSEU
MSPATVPPRPGAPEWDGELIVTEREVVADGVVMIALGCPDGSPLPRWDPGAHVDLVLAPTIIRQYSLCGDPGDRASWRIAVLREPESRGGSRLVHDSLIAGSTVRVRGPRNNFPLVDADRYLFIAGGIGITPIRTMIAAAEAAGREWTLLYGGRTRGAMAFLNDFDDRAPTWASSASGRVVVTPQDEAGLLDLDAHLGAPDPGAVVYCCGPEGLLDAVESKCATWPPGSLHVERFRPRGDAQSSASRFQVELRRSARTITVERDRSILQTLENAGVDVLTSCEEGTCGTCMVPVLDGIPDHRDSVLTGAERASGEQILVCVSRSHSPTLVLDL